MLQSLPKAAPLYRSILGELSAAEQRPFLAGAPLRKFADGQLIQSAGDSASGCWLIESGRVKLGRIALDGRLIAVSLLGPGDSYGELALLRRAPRVVDALALGPAALRWISATRFERVLSDQPRLMRAMLAGLGEQLHLALGQIIAGRGESAGAQLVRLLASLCANQSGPVELRLTQQELADLAGVTRMTVSRELRRLAQGGFVATTYGAIVVPSPAALAGLAGSTE